MRNFAPSVPFSTAIMLIIPQNVTVKGSTKKSYPETGEIIYCNFRSFGGTEITSNGVYSLENTVRVQTWYRPDIKADCRIKLDSGELYEIVGEPENVSMRNQYMTFTIRQIKGGA